MCRSTGQTAPDTQYKAKEFIITHPFHPLYNKCFIISSSHWVMGREWIQFKNTNGRLSSIRADWTNLCAPDIFVSLSQGRASFILKDLLQLVELIDSLRKKPNKKGKRENKV